MQRQFSDRLTDVVENYYHFASRAAAASKVPRCRLSETRRVINRSCEESDVDGRIPAEWLPAKLVLTSPPYPGVHVLYHRWQINGRRETPAPFWLAGCRDGAGDAHYCLGRRDQAELRTYFARLGKAFSAVRNLVNEVSLVVQLVACSAPDWQLPMFVQERQEAELVGLAAGFGCGYSTWAGIWRRGLGEHMPLRTKGKFPWPLEMLN